MTLKVDRLVQVLKIIEKDPRRAAHTMTDEVGCSVPTIRRLLRAARKELKVDVRWHPSPLVDDPGQYKIHSYGLLNMGEQRKPEPLPKHETEPSPVNEQVHTRRRG